MSKKRNLRIKNEFPKAISVTAFFFIFFYFFRFPLAFQFTRWLFVNAALRFPRYKKLLIFILFLVFLSPIVIYSKSLRFLSRYCSSHQEVNEDCGIEQFPKPQETSKIKALYRIIFQRFPPSIKGEIDPLLSDFSQIAVDKRIINLINEVISSRQYYLAVEKK